MTVVKPSGDEHAFILCQLMAELPLCFSKEDCRRDVLSAQLRQIASMIGAELLAIYQMAADPDSAAAGIQPTDTHAELALRCVASVGSAFPELLRCTGQQVADGRVKLPTKTEVLLLPLQLSASTGYLLLSSCADGEVPTSLLQPWCRLLQHYLNELATAQQEDTNLQLLQHSTSAAAAVPWQLDTQTDVLTLDAAGYKLFGLTQTHELTQQWLFQHMHPDDVNRCRSAFSKYLRGQSALYDCISRVWHSGGYWIWIHSRAQNRCFAGGQQKLTGLYFDLSERMQTQIQLETLAACVPGVVFQYLRQVNGHRSFPYLSPQAEQLFALSLDTLKKDATPFLQKVHPDDLDLLRQQLDKSSESLEILQARFRIRALDGEYVWYQGKAQPEQLAHGDVLWHGHLSDISAEIVAEEEMRIAREQAEQASRFKSSFLANMSHEIRTPMNGVLGMIDVLNAGLTDPQQQANIRIMRESATALLTVIDDILDFSKLDAGKLNVVCEPCKLSELLQQIIGVLDELALKQQVFLSFFIDPSVPGVVMADGGRIRQVLLNLLSNAIKFSAGSGRLGQVHLSLTVLDRDEHDALLCFSVRDNGIGMSEHSLQRLFKPFIQADDSTSRRFGGTGLGLSISQQLIHLMGGFIEVSSELDLGSEFRVMLPVQVLYTSDGPAPTIPVTEVVIISRPPSMLANDWSLYLQSAGCAVQMTSSTDTVEPAASERRVWLIDLVPAEMAATLLDFAAKLRQQQPQDGIVLLGRGRRRSPRLLAEKQVYLDANALSRPVLFQAIDLAVSGGQTKAASTTTAVLPPPCFEQKVLVVEDNSTNQIVIRQMLLQLGYQSDVASDGVQGLQLAQQVHYDLILTDLHMPVLDGYEFCRAWRDIESLQNLPAIPVLALTANVMKEEQKRCLDAGMNGCLTKPLPIATLQQALAQWLPQVSTAALLSQSEHTLSPQAMAGSDVSARFDRHLLAKTVGADAVEEVLTDYAASFHQHMQELLIAMNAEQFAQAGAIAHKLKSSSSFVGLIEFAKSLSQLEQAAKGQTSTLDCKELWLQCQAAAQSVQLLLRQL